MEKVLSRKISRRGFQYVLKVKTMPETRKCPFTKKVCWANECMLYLPPIQECVIAGLNRTIFKLSQGERK